jgi:hypothetical protein
MRGYDLRPKLKSDGPSTESRLAQNDDQQHTHKGSRGVLLTPTPSNNEYRKNQQQQGACDVPMTHLPPSFSDLNWGIRVPRLSQANIRNGFRHSQEPVAARPIRATQTGVGQSCISAYRHHENRQNNSKANKPSDQNISQFGTP